MGGRHLLLAAGLAAVLSVGTGTVAWAAGVPQLPAPVAGLLGVPGGVSPGEPAMLQPGCTQTDRTAVTCTYETPGETAMFVVPLGVRSVDVSARGAAGGAGSGLGLFVSGGAPGAGALVTSTVSVQSQAVLTVRVGARGGAGGEGNNDGAGGPGGAGGQGYGAGGNGAAGPNGGDSVGGSGGGGGGGGSALLTANPAPAPLVVAGAGAGGGGGGNNGSPPATGGDGGDSAQDGNPGGLEPGTPGSAGTSPGGANGEAGRATAQLSGGGGGGGGGAAGGGGGVTSDAEAAGGPGGGGGTSVGDNITNGENTPTSATSGNGQVVITYRTDGGPIDIHDIGAQAPVQACHNSLGEGVLGVGASGQRNHDSHHGGCHQHNTATDKHQTHDSDARGDGDNDSGDH